MQSKSSQKAKICGKQGIHCSNPMMQGIEQGNNDQAACQDARACGESNQMRKIAFESKENAPSKASLALPKPCMEPTEVSHGASLADRLANFIT